MKKTIVLLLLAILMLSSCELVRQDPAEGKKIYLVSVALDYRETNLNTLSGTVNDQIAMESQLEFLCRKEGVDYECLAFTASHGIWTERTTLYQARTNERIATRSTISRSSLKKALLSTLGALSERVDADDILIFYYAGHGANAKDESDMTLNGALVVGDIYFPSVGYWQDEGTNLASMVSLYELKSLLSHFACPKLIILDSCYSGSLLPESRPSEARGEIMASISSLFSAPDRGNGGYYLLTSSASDEVSYEDDSYGMAHGFFSGQVLRSLGYNFYDDGIEGTGYPDGISITVSGIYEDLEKSGITQYQRPQLNAYQIDLVLFTLPDLSRF